jgi:protein gp37
VSENTKIEWADHTFNPWEGCQKVGPGCDHCYAEARNARFGGGQAVNWGPGAPRRRTSDANWRLPLKWNRQAAADGRRFRVFCASLADVFDNEVDPMWRVDLLKLIAETPNLDWLLLTKRIGNVRQMMADAFRAGWPEHGSVWERWGEMFSNIWIGATVVNQAEADRDIRKLLAVPASVRFLSIEPMLGPVNLKEVEISGSGHHEFDPIIVANVLHPFAGRPRIDWVIVGGESGPNARPMHPQWARNLRDQCAEAMVPFMFKQWGEWVPRSACHHRFGNHKSCVDMDPCAEKWPCIKLNEDGSDGNDLCIDSGRDSAYMQRVGKKMAGRLLDGVTHDGFPAVKKVGAA